MSIIHVTPTLSVDEGDLETFVDLDEVTETIRQRKCATVTTLWEAEQVLRNLGMSEYGIQRRITFGVTGRMLPLAEPTPE